MWRFPPCATAGAATSPTPLPEQWARSACHRLCCWLSNGGHLPKLQQAQTAGLTHALVRRYWAVGPGIVLLVGLLASSGSSQHYIALGADRCQRRAVALGVLERARAGQEGTQGVVLMRHLFASEGAQSVFLLLVAHDPPKILPTSSAPSFLIAGGLGFLLTSSGWRGRMATSDTGNSRPGWLAGDIFFRCHCERLTHL